MRFLHCADIHLDSPLRGLDRYPGAPVDRVRNATRRAFENLVDLALAEQVAFVIIAGDLYDGDWPDFNTGLYFIEQVSRLRQHHIRVFLLRGNHDAESKITRQLRLPDNVFLFPSDRPVTDIDVSLGIAVHGMSFPKPVVETDLAASYPARVDGLLNIGVLHTCLAGSDEHANYAPCSLAGLLSKNYDYWALGHVHRRQVVHRQPWVVFPGNTQGRHIRESGSKGCELVTVENGVVLAVDHHSLDVLRWAEVEVDCAGAESFADVLERVQNQLLAHLRLAEGRMLAARVRLHGRCTAHDLLAAQPETARQEVRAAAIASGYGEVWVEKIEIATSPPLDREAMLSGGGPLGELFGLVRTVEQSDEELALMSNCWHDLRRKLPAELCEGRDGVLPESADEARSLLNEAANLLAARLLETGTHS